MTAPHTRPLALALWRRPPAPDVALGALLDQADATAPLVERHLWLIALLAWVRRGEPISGTQCVLRMLQEHPQQRARVVALLAAFWRDMDVAALWADHGFAPRSAFLNELGERLRQRVLPQSPDTSDLARLFHLLLDVRDDRAWVSQLDEGALSALAALWREAVALALADAASPSALGWREPFWDAITYLVSQVRSAGLSPAFRSRLGTRVNTAFAPALSEAGGHGAFQQLARVSDHLHALALSHAQARATPGEAADDPALTQGLLQEAQYLRALLDQCAEAARGLHGHLESQGISVDLVFQIDQLCARCIRVERLLEVVLSPQPVPALHALVVDLMAESERRQSVRALFKQHYSMLARKVAERSAETGEHYITRNGHEYRDMLWRAGGGGAVIAGTTYMKFIVLSLALSPFWAGLGAGLNYAISFVIVQLMHCTVATKQPAMTAPALAMRLADTRSAQAIEGFVDEVAHLIRSQMAGIIGNLAAVIPLVLAAQGLAWLALGRPLIDAHTAHHVLETLTLKGPTLWYAAFTGVLLFASSLIAGWCENWFVLHRLDSALAWNPRIREVLGPERAQRWSLWWRENISGLAANVSLGLLLGVVPVLASFVAAPLDVRHVTLSTGQLMAALGTLGEQAWRDPNFWWCVAAIPLTGLLNVSVSFVLALRVAVRSREVRVKDQALLRAAVWRRLRRQPLSFLLPPRSSGGRA